MFGYVIANKEALTNEQLVKYKACYCGLCNVLNKKYGNLGRNTLTYDMTFLIILLSSVYILPYGEDCERCVIHPIKKHVYNYNEVTEYAADLNIALAYYKFLDDWKDDNNPLSFIESKLFKKKCLQIEKNYPRQCNVIKKSLKKLDEVEQSNCNNPDIPAECFGELMGELFVWRDDDKKEILRNLGFALGKFIYIMDAVMDLKSDIKHEQYNPLVTFSTSNFRPILEMLIGECTIEFEKLNLSQDVEILRNILYSGVWTKYEMKEKRYENGTKSI